MDVLLRQPADDRDNDILPSGLRLQLIGAQIARHRARQTARTMTRSSDDTSDLHLGTRRREEIAGLFFLHGGLSSGHDLGSAMQEFLQLLATDNSSHADFLSTPMRHCSGAVGYSPGHFNHCWQMCIRALRKYTIVGTLPDDAPLRAIRDFMGDFEQLH